jgi:hypothetical protein
MESNGIELKLITKKVPKQFIITESGDELSFDDLLETINDLEDTSFGFEMLLIDDDKIAKWLVEKGLAIQSAKGSYAKTRAYDELAPIIIDQIENLEIMEDMKKEAYKIFDEDGFEEIMEDIYMSKQEDPLVIFNKKINDYLIKYNFVIEGEFKFMHKTKEFDKLWKELKKEYNDFITKF